MQRLLFLHFYLAVSFLLPHLERLSTIAADPLGHLRDPSSVVQGTDGSWHFYVDFIPLSQGTQDGWHAVLHHYSSPSIVGPWHFRDLALNWSSDETAFDAWGVFSPSVFFSAEERIWYLFYTGTPRNYTQFQATAQLLATSPSPDGPWTRRGLVCTPAGAPPLWQPQWNARRCDSGRALVVGGRKGFWTKGVRGESFGQEGVFFPRNASSFLPPYENWFGNPIYNASGNPGSSVDGYENCEFFSGPLKEEGGPWTHVLCQNHGPGQPHFITKDALNWTFMGTINTAPALEPTPVYAGVPGDAATVEYFIARANGGNLHIDLFHLTWE